MFKCGECGSGDHRKHEPTCSYYCDCYKHERQVCDICQGVDKNSKDQRCPMTSREKCPTCGSNVRIEGDTTKYYVPEAAPDNRDRAIEILSDALAEKCFCGYGEHVKDTKCDACVALTKANALLIGGQDK